MSKRKQYPEEFKREAVRLVLRRGDRSIKEIAASLGIPTSHLFRWRQKRRQKP